MLPTVSIHPTDPTDIGALAEAAIFFPKTRWVVSARMLAQLVGLFGWGRLHRFLDVSGVTLVLERSLISSQRDADGISIGVVSLQRSIHHNYVDVEEEVEHRLLQRFGLTKANRAQIERLMPRLDAQSAEYDAGQAAIADMLDSGLTTRIARRLSGPDVQGSFFRFERRDGPLHGANWAFETDFPVRPHDGSGHPSMLDPEGIARSIYATTREVVRNADGRTDLWLPPNMASTLQCKVEVLAERSEHDRRQIDIFEEVVFERRSISEAINSQERSLDDVLAFFEHPDTQRWRGWIATQRADASLIENYFRGVYEPAKHFDSQPWKAGRLVIMAGTAIASASLTNGLSLAASAATGAVQSATEATIGRTVSHLLEPWRPNQWVDLAARDLLNY